MTCKAPKPEGAEWIRQLSDPTALSAPPPARGGFDAGSGPGHRDVVLSFPTTLTFMCATLLQPRESFLKEHAQLSPCTHRASSPPAALIISHLNEIYSLCPVRAVSRRHPAPPRQPFPRSPGAAPQPCPVSSP